MSRAWRIEYEGALYHVLSRGNELGKDKGTREIADKLEVTSIHLSMSHTETLANAFVIINNHK